MESKNKDSNKNDSNKNDSNKNDSNKNDSNKSESNKNESKNKTGKVKISQNAAEGLRELFIHSLKDIYWAEKALTKALPKMIKNATNRDLISTIEEHLAVTEQQVTRLEDVFVKIGERAVAKKCEAMEGLIKEGESSIEETEPGPVRDAGIIAASQKIEHYEIATYGTLVAFASTLGEDEVADLLIASFEEEKEADVALTENAYNSINFDAADLDK